MLCKRNIKVRLKFAKENVDKDQNVWNVVLGQTSLKLNYLGTRTEDVFGITQMGCPNFFT